MQQTLTIEAGKILPFAPPAARWRRTAPAAAPAGGGAVLLFTGVRYERPRDTASTPAPERREG